MSKTIIPAGEAALSQPVLDDGTFVLNFLCPLEKANVERKLECCIGIQSRVVFDQQ